jgi:hypothetical protein
MFHFLYIHSFLLFTSLSQSARMELRASPKIGKCHTTELHLQLCVFPLGVGDWPQFPS